MVFILKKLHDFMFVSPVCAGDAGFAPPARFQSYYSRNIRSVIKPNVLAAIDSLMENFFSKNKVYLNIHIFLKLNCDRHITHVKITLQLSYRLPATLVYSISFFKARKKYRA